MEPTAAPVEPAAEAPAAPAEAQEEGLSLHVQCRDFGKMACPKVERWLAESSGVPLQKVFKLPNWNYAFVTILPEHEKKFREAVDGLLLFKCCVSVNEGAPRKSQPKSDEERPAKRQKVKEVKDFRPGFVPTLKDLTAKLKNKDPGDVLRKSAPLIDWSYETQLSMKGTHIKTAVRSFTKQVDKKCKDLSLTAPPWTSFEWSKACSAPIGCACPLDPPIGTPAESLEGYRNKCEFSIGKSEEGDIECGFVRRITDDGYGRIVASCEEVYTKGLDECDENFPPDQRGLLLANRSQCWLKLSDFQKGLDDANACLELLPEHVKSLFRRATALEQLGRETEALSDFARVARADPGCASPGVGMTLGQGEGLSAGSHRALELHPSLGVRCICFVSMFDFEDIEADVERKGAEAWQEAAEGTGAAGPSGPSGPAFAHRRPGAAIEVGKKVIIRGAPGAPELDEKIGEIMGFEEGKYSVKVMNLTGGYVPGRALNEGSHMRLLAPESLELHPDQVEKDRQAAEDGAIVLLGGSEAERAAREALYSLSIDPKHCYDKAVERILAARHEFEVLNLEAKWYGSDLSLIKRAYRRISVGIHPDKNSHPQAVDCFRKVYGAFETLMDKKQQWRLLFILNRLKDDEVSLYELEAEEEERFEWWLEANVPEIEKQAAEIEGGEFEEIGEKWISDGTGGNVNDVKWAGMAESLRLHAEDKALFIDCRERFEFEIEHIDGAFNIPMREFVDFGLAGVAGPWVKEVLKRKDQPVIIYSEVATPFSRCRAMCRWLLRAGSKSLPAERLRRLRGGMFGWRHKKGKILLAIKDITLEQKAALYRESAKQIGALKPGLGAVNLRVRVRCFEERPEGPEGPEGPCAMLHDSSGGILTLLTTKEQIALCREAAKQQASLLVRGATCELSSEKHLLARLGPEATLERSDRDFTFGFDAKNVSEEVRAPEPEEEEEEPPGRGVGPAPPGGDLPAERPAPGAKGEGQSIAESSETPATKFERRYCAERLRHFAKSFSMGNRGEAAGILSAALLSLGDAEQTLPEIRQACLRSLCLVASGRDRDDLEAADARMQMRGKLDTPSPAAADARSRLRAALSEEGYGLLRRLGKRCRGHGGCLSQLALLLSYCQEPEDEAALELLAEALDVDEAEVSKAALVSLNAIFDARRQQGSSGKAVVFNPGLRRCLE
ncbi:TTL3, partial [Symbiodinium sp. CCMP2456]